MRQLSAVVATAALAWTGTAAAATAAGPALAHNAGGASITVTSPAGTNVVPEEGPVTVTIEAADFQTVVGGFGGVYVMFGWVDGENWQPSQGGSSGATYLFLPDTQAADNEGFLRFVSFPGSATAEEANGGVLTEDGAFTTEMVIPGPVVHLGDAAGDGREVDCRVETCGIITIGGHGQINANNETFTPLEFVAGGAGDSGDQGTDTGDASGDATAEEPSEEPSTESTSGPVATPSDAATEADAADDRTDNVQERVAPQQTLLVRILAAVIAVGAMVWVVVRSRNKRRNLEEARRLYAAHLAAEAAASTDSAASDSDASDGDGADGEADAGDSRSEGEPK